VLAWADAFARNVTVLGETRASPVVHAQASSEFPAPGADVSVDLSGTTAGAFGPATTFRADWGDGTLTDWQSEPFLAHAYAEAGDHMARFQVGNDAGQTSSQVVVLHVGGTPPPRLNPIQQAFAPENQDATWGVIGLVVAAAGTLYGFTRLRRRRSRLAQQLDALEAAYAGTCSDPPACEAALARERAAARALLVEGKLDEAHFAVLDRRIDELRAQFRQDVLEHQLDFLPARLLRDLRAALADGRISSLERRHVLDALERDPTLTPDYKAMVRRLVEEWHARDAGS
jgi:hypothetical protein